MRIAGFLIAILLLMVSVEAQNASVFFNYAGKQYSIQKSIDPAKKFANVPLSLDGQFLKDELGQVITSGLAIKIEYSFIHNDEKVSLPNELKVREEVETLYHNVKGSVLSSLYSIEVPVVDGVVSDVIFVGTSRPAKSLKALEMVKRQKVFVVDNKGFEHLFIDQLIAINWDKGVITLIPTQDKDLAYVAGLKNNQVIPNRLLPALAKN